MITVKLDEDILTAVVLGEFTLADFRELEEHIRYAARSGPVKLLIDLADMVGYTIDVAWEDIRFSHEHRYDFAKVAVVAGNPWQAWLAWLEKLLVAGEVRRFTDHASALAWLKTKSPACGKPQA